MAMKKFNALSERETLALAISLEEEDERVYADFSEGLKQDFPASASVFDSMRGEESDHRRRLIELYRQKFGEHIPLIRRQDVKGFVQRKPIWLMRPLGIESLRRETSAIEVETRRFYEKAAMRAEDASIRQLLDDLAEEERAHEDRVQELTEEKLQPECQRKRGQSSPAALRPADRATGLGGTHGRLSIDACPGVRRGSGNPKFLGCVPGWFGRLARRRHKHGFCGSFVRRWQPYGTWPSVAPRTRLRSDDCDRWHRSYVALPDSRLSPCHGDRVDRRPHRTCSHHMG